MKRTGLIYGGVAAALAAALSSIPLAPPASAISPARPGTPTNVTATSTAGAPGVSVTWDPPTSAGAAPIVFYLASSYSGIHSCVVIVPAPTSCSITGIRNGSVPHAIRVRAFNAVGASPAAAVFSVVTTPAAGGGTPSGPVESGQGGSGASGTPTGGTTSASGSTSGAGATDMAVSSGGSTDTSTTGVTAELPFTGVNLSTFFLLGSVMVLAGLGLLRPNGRRSMTMGRRLASVPRWFFGL